MGERLPRRGQAVDQSARRRVDLMDSGATKLGLLNEASDWEKSSPIATGRSGSASVRWRLGRSRQAPSGSAAREGGAAMSGADEAAVDPALDPTGSRRLRPNGHHAMRRSSLSGPSSALLDSGVQRADLRDEPLALEVIEIEDLLTRPVQVVRDVRDLLVQPVGRVRLYSPRRPPDTSTANRCEQDGQVTAARVCPSVLTRR